MIVIMTGQISGQQGFSTNRLDAHPINPYGSRLFQVSFELFSTSVPGMKREAGASRDLIRKTIPALPPQR